MLKALLSAPNFFFNRRINLSINSDNILNRLKRGDILYNIEGHNISEAIRNSVNLITTPKGFDKEAAISAIIAREEIMPTTIGRGIAIPHTQNPIIDNADEEILSICFLKNPIQHKAIDSIPVSILFILLASTAQNNMDYLYKVSYLCQQDDFYKLLSKQAHKRHIFNYIKNKERDWDKKRDSMIRFSAN